MIACDHREYCSHNQECGGAVPHDRCSECDNCPIIPEARCVEVEAVVIKCRSCEREYTIAKGDSWKFCDNYSCGHRLKEVVNIGTVGHVSQHDKRSLSFAVTKIAFETIKPVSIPIQNYYDQDIAAIPLRDERRRRRKGQRRAFESRW